MVSVCQDFFLDKLKIGCLLGVQDSAVSKWEKGRVDNLTITQIKTMPEIFGVSPMYLAGWVDDPQWKKEKDRCG